MILRALIGSKSSDYLITSYPYTSGKLSPLEYIFS